MSFITMKGQGKDTRVDGAIEYVRKMHESLIERIDDIEGDVRLVQDQTDYLQRVVHSINRDVKALESKPSPVIPLVPDISPLRTEIAKQGALLSSFNKEMELCLKTVRDQVSVSKDLRSNIASIKVPEPVSLKLTYWWLSALTLLNLLVWSLNV